MRSASMLRRTYRLENVRLAGLADALKRDLGELQETKGTTLDATALRFTATCTQPCNASRSSRCKHVQTPQTGQMTTVMHIHRRTLGAFASAKLVLTKWT